MIFRIEKFHRIFNRMKNKLYLSYTETPLQEIFHPVLENAGIRLLVKREDLNHHTVSGNKWWKLKYNLIDAINNQSTQVLTFGGAFSNHIYATAAATSLLGIKCIGIIRGERTNPLNPTLKFAENAGMYLHFISRTAYRSKNETAFIEELSRLFGKSFIIPEGGTNLQALKGCKEFSEKLEKIDFDKVVVPIGTGGTITGIISGIDPHKETVGVAILKNGQFLQEEVTSLLQQLNMEDRQNFKILSEYHHGGYAKVTPPLLDFIRYMKINHNLPLDHVYTAKLLWAIFEEARRNNFKRGTTLLAIHTGGLQGSQEVLF
jgi:1-aminocyclopropane-1-carboxylate deaminase